jgi:hypothetical protein
MSEDDKLLNLRGIRSGKLPALKAEPAAENPDAYKVKVTYDGRDVRVDTTTVRSAQPDAVASAALEDWQEMLYERETRRRAAQELSRARMYDSARLPDLGAPRFSGPSTEGRNPMMPSLDTLTQLLDASPTARLLQDYTVDTDAMSAALTRLSLGALPAGQMERALRQISWGESEEQRSLDYVPPTDRPTKTVTEAESRKPHKKSPKWLTPFLKSISRKKGKT